MPSLSNELRNGLENVVKKARVIAERGAKSALEALTVHEAKSGGHLDAAGRDLRARLRAHAKQLGDTRKPNGEQAIGRLIRECAYEHWHRMLFARFLAENDLLIHPEHNVSVSLDDVLELAREAGIDEWELASRFATRMLPQIFRQDDPVLAVALPRERTLELEQLLESLPASVFKADDSLGWVYQFWQAEEKTKVNASGEKITGETLPAVTQLFTEHYMVLFLLHNTIGAWHAGKVLQSRDRKGAVLASEADARAAVALPDYSFEYLRFIREPREGDEDGKPTGPWRPAAGTFDGWPRAAKDLKVLDPCCGSGHFLVAAFDLLVRLRMEEEGLALEAAIPATLADNLFGLELDARCTQIAAFNLALAAWRMVGRPIDLPTMNIACCGLGPHASEDDWLQLAEQSGVAMPKIGREPIKNGLRNMHALFSQAPELGALIDPTELPGDLIAADWETLQPYLTGILKVESRDEDARERAVAAAGMAKAAELLAGAYWLVITNVPYLGRGKQGDILRAHLEARYDNGKADLSTAFVVRCLALCDEAGTTAVVTPQNWLFLTTYTKFRRSLLRTQTVNAAILLGSNAFQDMNWWAANTALTIVSECRPKGHSTFLGMNVGADKVIANKIAFLRGLPRVEPRVHDGFSSTEMIGPLLLSQRAQLENPDSRITMAESVGHSLLREHAYVGVGVQNGDSLRLLRLVWELPWPSPTPWTPIQTAPLTSGFDRGCDSLIWYDENQLNDEGISWHPQAVAVDGRTAFAIRNMGRLPSSRVCVELVDQSATLIVAQSKTIGGPLWTYLQSDDFRNALRQIDQKVNITPATFGKVPFDVAYWQNVANEEFPHGLPDPESDDPTQWLFHGRPDASTAPLQVAVARLLGYRWPAELDEKMHLSTRARELVQRCAELAPFADDDGVVCIPSVRGERPAADRLAALLAACGIRPDRDLDAWLREEFFAEHCKLFHDRPFIWHIWDGRKDGFHALVNYHKLAAPGGAGRKLLESLTHSYLGDWIKDQKGQVGDGKPGAEARLTAALDLKAELERILAGEPPYDIFVRWKPLREQPVGWEPDINDGVRLNIRPFLMAKDVGRKGAGVLRCKPNIKWTKDRGKEPQSLRPKADFPWFWSCDPEKHAAHRTNFAGGDTFDGNRWNDLHYTNAFKQAARERRSQEVPS